MPDFNDLKWFYRKKKQEEGEEAQQKSEIESWGLNARR